jgi:ATP-dependent Clp protease ATP-binding subunit ClpX
MAELPDFRKMESDIREMLSKKYGVKLQVAGLGPTPQADAVETDEGNEEAGKEAPPIRFDMKPTELKAYLDEYMVRQDDAKEVLATKICTHFNRIKTFQAAGRKGRSDGIGAIKNNIIMIGPTGVGKTYLVKLIASKIGVPFVKGDATKFSETGYVGGDVEDLVRDLVHEAGGNIELAQFGIIYLDEVDKIAASDGRIGPDVSRAGVQRALLKPMEETEVELRVPHDPVAQMEALMQFQKTGKREDKKINTRHILFIMSGAFGGLEEIVRKRLFSQGIGFGAEIRSKDQTQELLKEVKSEDLVAFGFESEFIGRLPVITTFEALETEDLYRILRNPKNPIVQGKKRDFKAYGIDLQFEDAALRRLAENAARERTGARGLVSAMEKALLKFEHRLPSTEIHRLVVTRALVDGPAAELARIIAGGDGTDGEAVSRRLAEEEQGRWRDLLIGKGPEMEKTLGIPFAPGRIALLAERVVRDQADPEEAAADAAALRSEAMKYAEEFSKKNGITLSFTEDAVDALIGRAWREGSAVAVQLAKALANYEYGLNLIKEKTGRDLFRLDGAAMENPDAYLNGLIQETYKT